MTQMNSILNHLKDHNHINTWIAFTEYKCTRLADVIFKLKKKGVVIDTEMKYNEKTKTKWAQYNLISLGLKA